MRGAGKLLELSEVPLLTAATAATLETPWTIGVGIAPKNLKSSKEQNQHFSTSYVLLSGRIVAMRKKQSTTQFLSNIKLRHTPMGSK